MADPGICSSFDISVSALTLQYFLSEYDFDAVFHKHPCFQVNQQVIQFGRPSSRHAETAVLCSSFTVPVPHRPQTPSQHIPVLVGRRTPPLMNSRQRDVRKRVLIRVQLNSSTVPSSRNVTNSQFNSVLSNCRNIHSSIPSFPLLGNPTIVFRVHLTVSCYLS